jgi:hypothetical protein
MDDPADELLKVDNFKKISPKGSNDTNVRSEERRTKRRRRRQPMAGEGGQMSKLTGIELKCAQLVPSAMFASPDAVVRSKSLSLPQKIAILRRWEFDMRQGTAAGRTLAVSDEMRLLEEVRGALADLGVAGSVAEIERRPVAAH